MEDGRKSTRIRSSLAIGRYPSVLVVSSNARLRKKWIRSLAETYPVQEAADYASFEKCLASRMPSVLLLDLALPRMQRVGGLHIVRDLCPSAKIILFAADADDAAAIKALKAGAKGYCPRNIDPGLLPKVVEVAQNGEIWAGRKVIARFLEELASASEEQRGDLPLPRHVAEADLLTPRENQIVHLIASGEKNKEIAGQLGISERTVKAHLTSVFRKTGISDRLRLALLIAQDHPDKPENEEKDGIALGLRSNRPGS